MVSAFTPTSSSATMLSRTLTGCLANLIGHAEAAEQDRGRRGKIRRLGVLAFCGASARRGLATVAVTPSTRAEAFDPVLSLWRA
jgi:hypothetical protein